jgi:hypothetical protein
MVFVLSSCYPADPWLATAQSPFAGSQLDSAYEVPFSWNSWCAPQRGTPVYFVRSHSESVFMALDLRVLMSQKAGGSQLSQVRQRRKCNPFTAPLHLGPSAFCVFSFLFFFSSLPFGKGLSYLDAQRGVSGLEFLLSDNNPIRGSRRRP